MNPDGDARKTEVEKSCSLWMFARGARRAAVAVLAARVSARGRRRRDRGRPGRIRARRPPAPRTILPRRPECRCGSNRSSPTISSRTRTTPAIATTAAWTRWTRSTRRSSGSRPSSSGSRSNPTSPSRFCPSRPSTPTRRPSRPPPPTATSCWSIRRADATIYKIAESKTPTVLFIRHKSGPYYLWHEIAHWRLLRRNDDSYRAAGHHAWTTSSWTSTTRCSGDCAALYGLKNAKGTKMLAIGGLAAYCKPGQETGPAARQGGLGLPVRDHLGRGLHQAAGRRPGERESRRGGPAADQGPAWPSRT